MLYFVLDHANFFAEMTRVLKPGGRAIHVMPTRSWRFWTNAFHYVGLGGSLLRKLQRLRGWPPDRVVTDEAKAAIAPRAPARKKSLARELLPSPLGIEPTTRREWHRWGSQPMRQIFAKHGFELQQALPLGLFYMPGLRPAGHWQRSTHRCVSALLGSCSVAYLTAPQDERGKPGNDDSGRPQARRLGFLTRYQSGRRA